MELSATHKGLEQLVELLPLLKLIGLFEEIVENPAAPSSRGEDLAAEVSEGISAMRRSILPHHIMARKYRFSNSSVACLQESHPTNSTGKPLLVLREWHRTIGCLFVIYLQYCIWVNI